MNSHPFEQFRLSKSILRAVTEEGYQQPTPVQVAAIPEVLAGRDLLATAQTGTGKTAAFALPMLDRLYAQPANEQNAIRALILTPTRELALQVETSFRTYGRYLPLKTAVVLGGISQDSQVKALRKQPDILVATPGRLLDLIDQKVLFVDQANKGLLLAEILKGKDVRRALVFTRTKHRAERLMRHLASHGISTDAIHSNKSQNARQRALLAFDKGKITVLVATDIVARGIDVEGISHVINYALPNDPESYVHRIGRTARAGAVGTALSFCDASEVLMLKGIEKLTRSPLIAVENHRYHSAAVASLRSPGSNPPPVQWRSFGPGGRSGRRR